MLALLRSFQMGHLASIHHLNARFFLLFYCAPKFYCAVNFFHLQFCSPITFIAWLKSNQHFFAATVVMKVPNGLANALPVIHGTRSQKKCSTKERTKKKTGMTTLLKKDIPKRLHLLM